jgi:hypothetical protein
LRAQRVDGRDRPQEGQILVLFAMVIVVIMLFASIVVDVGLLRNNRQILVNAVDSAALAGGTKMPVDACNIAQSTASACTSINTVAWQSVRDLIIQTLQATYPGIAPANYTISYRCLIGINSASPPAPYISRDVPLVCNPRGALGHTPVATDFKGAGATRYSVCDPTLGDMCNVVVITGQATTSYTFGRVVGINEGYTGTTVSAACNGPCGQSPAAPVDLVVLVDRTASMTDPQIVNARDATRSILSEYDPALQRVALGFLGPSEPNTSCNGTGGPAVSVNAIDSSAPSAPAFSSSDSAATPLAGASSLTINRPGAASAAGHVLIAGITVNNSILTGGSGNVQIVAPAGWTSIRTTNNGSSVGLATFYKVGTASEPGTYQWTFRNASTGVLMTVRATGGIARYTGVDNVNPINADGGNTGSDVSGTINATANAITATRANVALVAFLAMANGSGGTATDYFGTWTNSTTERFDRRGGNTAGPSIAAASKTVASVGATGATTATVAGGGSYAAQHVALSPDVSNHYGTTYPADRAKWIPIGFTGTDSDTPAPAWNEAYVNGSGTLQNGTHIVSAINCFDHPGGTGTNLTTPIAMAAAYLQQYGRPNVKWGILFETDGQPSYGSTGDPGNYTCASAVAAASAAKAITNANGENIELFTVGFFDSGSDPDCPDSSGTYSGQNVTRALAAMASTNQAPSPNGTANGCIAAENTDGDHFFCQPKTSDLAEVFSVIATQFAGIRTHLIQLSPPPYVSSLTPSVGTRVGGTTVTVDGKYFTGTTSVTFGGASVPFVVVNDTQLVVNSPSGANGSSVQVIVNNDGGSSLPHAGSSYTYN